MRKILLLLSFLFLLIQNSYSQVTCADLIYVTPTGLGTAPGTIGSPTTLANALTLVTATRHDIKMLAGTYTYAQSFTIPSNTVLDGRYTVVAGEWVKNSSLTTVLNIAAAFETAASVGHYRAITLDGVSNVYLKDITINNTTNATGTTSSKGRTVYGVHVSNSSNFFFSRTTVSALNASNGLNGNTGAAGLSGFNGSTGHLGDDDDNNNCNDAGSAVSGRGGQGRNNVVVPPASCNQCNGCTGNTGANSTGLRRGGNGGGGGSGERDDGATTRAGGRGGNGGNFEAGGFGGVAIGSSAGCSDNDNGSPGNIGASGTTGTFTGGVGPTFSFNQYFIPGNQAAVGGNGFGGAGGGGGGGGKGQDGTFCDDGSGAGGGGGGGGGQGGVAGFGGFGGGGTFGIYGVIGNTGANLFDINVSTGTLGSGGVGGSGGAGGSAGIGAVGGTGGTEIGFGGRGGNGGVGGQGGLGQTASNGVSTNFQGVTSTGLTVPNPRTITASMFGGCTNSEIILTKNAGTWTSTIGAAYINDLTVATTSYNNGSSPAIISYGATGHYDIVIDGITYKNWVYIRDTRALPTFDPSMAVLMCEGDAMTLNTPTSGAQYEWVVFQDGNDANTPVAIYTTLVASFPTPIVGTNTIYHARLRIRDNCCGWSAPVYHTFTANQAGGALISTPDTICAGNTGTISVSGTAGVVDWYLDPLSTINVGTGTSFTSPTLTSSALYYVSEFPGCGGVTPVNITVDPLPLSPSSSSSLDFCSGEDVIIEGTGSGIGDLLFYDNTMTLQSTYTMGLATPTGSYNAGALAVGSYVYYLTEDGIDCESNVTAVSITVHPLPVAPVAVGVAGCPGESANLSATITATFGNWYSDVALTNLVATGSLFSTPPLFANTTYYVTQVDANGCESLASVVLVTVADAVNPVIAGCPANITVSNTLFTCGAQVFWTAPTATDNCPNVGLTSTNNSGDLFPVGTTTVTYTATDVTGNTATCFFDVIVNDTETPVFIACPADITQGNDLGNCDAVVTWTAPNFSDNCPGGTLTSTANPGDTFPLGTTTVTYTATDAAGNFLTCEFDVTITDTENPTLTACPVNITQGNDAGVCDALVTWPAPTGADNCPGVIVASTNNSGDTFPVGTTTVTYTATDAAGNTATCSFDVTVSDTEDPAIVGCPANIAQNNDAGLCDASVTWIVPTTTDNCLASVTLTSSHNPGDPFVVGTTTVMYVAADGAGNTDTCTFDVIITDTEPPTIGACPVDITQTASAGTCGTIITWNPPAASDNCTGMTLVPDAISGSTFPVGTTIVTYTATDIVGLTATCSFNVTVNDVEFPSFVGCPSNIIQSVDLGTCGAVVTWVIPTETDNCPGTVVTSSNNPGDTFPVGTTTVTYTATDVSGNATPCTFDVTVLDDENPSISACPLNITQGNDAGTCDAIVTWTVPTFVDNCTGGTMVSTHNSGDTFIAGTTTVTYTATDGVGNTSICSFDVIISDTENPSITVCAPDVDVNADGGCQAILVDYTGLVTASDNCTTLSLSQSPVSGTTITDTTTVTITVTDLVGNISTCNFDVNLVDINPPVIVCPANDSVVVGAGCVFIIPDYTASATITDNCDASPIVTQSPLAGTSASSVTPVTLIATDVTGNSSSCSFQVIPIDNVDPVITCMADTTTCSQLYIFNQPTATDNCGGTSVVQIAGLPSGSLYPVGTTTNTFVATDGFGNTDTCSFNLTVNLAPSLTVGGDVTIDQGEFVQLTATESGSTVILWTPGSTLDDSTLLNPTATPLDTTTYYIIVTNALGCTNSDSITVNVIPDSGIDTDDIDNLFTPNGDGKNDTWHINNIEAWTDYTLAVFNRWGQEVYTTTNYANDWNGNYQGQPLPEGAYYFVIDFSGSEPVTGSVTILRLKK
ncbi:MAG: gliding motility-associated-like protein [Parvicellaceae bacterium]|jgi:gliding motility-associated-like protein